MQRTGETCITRVWTKDEPAGMELAELRIGRDRLSAVGIAIGTDPEPYRLEYELTTVVGFVTKRLLVRTFGAGWRRALDLERGASGVWMCAVEAIGDLRLPAPGGDLAAVTGALDCDLALSPVTNAMPVLRHRLHADGGSVEFLMAWVSVPDLAVYPSRQRYTFIRRDGDARIVRYENLGGTFVADISFDDDGVVLDYPQLARRLAS